VSDPDWDRRPDLGVVPGGRALPDISDLSTGGPGPRAEPRVLRGRSVAAVVGALVVLTLATTGCGTLGKVSHLLHALHGNAATIDGFQAKVAAAPQRFEVEYTTTGAAPATVVYALNQGGNKLLFTETPTGAGTPSIDIIANSSGEYSCQPAAGGAAPTCERLPPSDRSNENSLFDFYTPAHWIQFLHLAATTATLAGDTVSSSKLTVNGFPMTCVDLVAPGTPGTSTICTTEQDVLGYVKVANDMTSFEITSFSSSPPSSLFQLPAGATITEVTLPTTTTAP
jgi:hypothetical protein